MKVLLVSVNHKGWVHTQMIEGVGEEGLEKINDAFKEVSDDLDKRPKSILLDSDEDQGDDI